MLIEKTKILNNGVIMPTLGLGVWQTGAGSATEQAVLWALEAGYRLIDTASIYGNEKEVGSAIKKSGIPRSELFITTKLWPSNFPRTKKAFEESVSRLGLDYIDLYLIHWPVWGFLHAWKEMTKLYEQKRIRAIGVSNFSSSHITSLEKNSKIAPAINQVHFNPFHFKEDLLEFCNTKNIVLEAYSPLTRGKHLSDKNIRDVAQKYSRTPAQIMLRWAIQHDTIVIPKSGNKERIIENAKIFEFEIIAEDMAALDAISAR